DDKFDFALVGYTKERNTDLVGESTGSRGAIEKKLRKMEFGTRFGMTPEFSEVDPKISGTTAINMERLLTFTSQGNSQR
ncbi:hypothetical protein Tco_1297228, partial [Tanacetum coccineum]